MPTPLSTDSTQMIHVDNIVGSPFTTIAGILAAASQYLGTQGAVWPHDTNSWISFGIGLAMAIAGGLIKQPGQ